MSKTGCRNNCAQDADAIAHGMHKHMGAGPAPAAWGSAPASGQGRQLCQKLHIDTVVLRMPVQLRMGCATGWGKVLGMRNDMGAGQKLGQQQVLDTTGLGCR